jgi:hypothetical protein
MFWHKFNWEWMKAQLNNYIMTDDELKKPWKIQTSAIVNWGK